MNLETWISDKTSDGHTFVYSLHHYHYYYIVSNDRYKQTPSVMETIQLFKHEERCNRYNFRQAQETRMMEPLHIF
jgi:hypothetical protein